MKSLYKETTKQHILFIIHPPLAISAMNKMGSMVSVEMNIAVHEIQDWGQTATNLVTATHITGIFNIETDFNFKPDIDLFAPD